MIKDSLKPFLRIAGVVLVTVTVLTGCFDEPTDGTSRRGTAEGRTDFTSPGWEGCYNSTLWITHRFSVEAVRCPNSSTSVQYKSGKVTKYVTTIDQSSLEAARQLIEQDEARKQALGKLTEQDRKLLGLEK